jgi:hypothetical protein
MDDVSKGVIAAAQYDQRSSGPQNRNEKNRHDTPPSNCGIQTFEVNRSSPQRGVSLKSELMGGQRRGIYQFAWARLDAAEPKGRLSHRADQG